MGKDVEMQVYKPLFQKLTVNEQGLFLENNGLIKIPSSISSNISFIAFSHYLDPNM